MSLYRNVLRQAWKITWTNKYLWFFGIFAALLGNGGEYEILVKGIGGQAGQAVFPGFKTLLSTGIFSSQALANLGNIIREDTFSFLMFIVLGIISLVLLCFLIWLSIVSQISLVSNSACYLTKKKCDFKTGIDTGTKKFWPVLGMNIINKLFILAAFLIVGLPLILTASRSTSAVANIFYVLAFVIFMILVLSLSFIVKYSIAFIVLKGDEFKESLQKGWNLFKSNWMVSLEMAFVLFVINFLVGLALVAAMFLLAIPFVYTALLFYKLISLTAFWIIAFIGMLLILAAIILSGGILASFQTSSWTALFLELLNKGGVSKIVRLTEKWLK